MNTIKTALLAGGLVVASIVSPMTSFAQGTSTNDQLYNQTPQGTTNNTGSTSTTNTQNEDRGFDWRWLLPLLAIPVIYMLTRRGEDTDRSHDTRQYSGAKGGRSTRRDDE